MPIYTFECPNCGKRVDKLRKMGDNGIVFCDCEIVRPGVIKNTAVRFPPEMKIVPSVPSPMQWGCRKGF